MRFAAVMNLAKNLRVLDLSQGPVEDLVLDPKNPQVVAIGKYGEHRPGSYTTPQYQGESPREYHVGIDLVASPGSPVFAFADGEIFANVVHDRALDYGPTLITQHLIDGKPLWALHGHLAAISISNWKVGTPIRRGEKLAEVGSKAENGGWFPHLHFQLSRIKPLGADLPGVVSVKDLEQALIDFPDPRQVLGSIY